MKYIAYGTDPAQADSRLIEEIERIAPDYRIVTGKGAADFAEVRENVEIAFREIEPELAASFPALRWYQAWSAGVDRLLADDEVRRADFAITTASGIHPVPMAEHIFSLLLTLSRGLNWAARFRSEKSWKRVPSLRLQELEGKTALLLGAGRIGRRTATIARAFGMRITAVKRRQLDRLGPYDEVVAWEAFREYLDASDVVINILPLTADTERLFGREEFRRMKNETIFINVGRGGTVDQQALVAALTEGEIAAAGLDVVDPEPLSPDSPLWEMENVVLTGHYGGITPRYEERGNEIFLKNLARYVTGKPLENLVDRERGY